eukprot:4821742-Karenia_brevis.AAC.1
MAEKAIEAARCVPCGKSMRLSELFEFSGMVEAGDADAHNCGMLEAGDADAHTYLPEPTEC